MSRQTWITRIFIILLVIWHLVLGWTQRDPNRWSGWINGDFQNLLTLRYWTRDGALSPHALLLITQGYTPFIKIFDGTSLDDHALSSAYEKDGRLVKRIYYNHYPSFYLLPIALVSWLASTSRPLFFQLTELAISASGLFFLFLFLERLFKSRFAAAIAASTYMVSELYVDWAHSLNNMPIDDFFRHGFLLLSVIEKTVARERKRLVTAALWLSFFFLSLVSLESMVFGFVWLIGYDVIREKRWRLPRWFLFGLAPVAARGIQFVQSIAAFGWTDARLDWFGRWSTMANQNGGTTPLERLLSISRELRYLVGFGYDKHNIIQLHLLTIVVTLSLFAGLSIIARHERIKTGSWFKITALYPALLFVAGCGFGFIFPGASWMRYEGRQFIPFFVALIAYAAVQWHELGARRQKIAVALLIFLPATLITLRQIQLTVKSFLGSPQYSFGKPEPEQQRLGKALTSHLDNRISMVFLYDPDQKLVIFYPHPQDPTRTSYAMSPQLLYAADAHVMGFNDISKLTHDLIAIEQQTNNQVRPYIVTDSMERFIEIQKQLSVIGFMPQNKTPDDLEGDGKWIGAEFTASSK